MKLLNETLTQNGQTATLQILLWENSPEFQTDRKRPAIVVVSGGGYKMVSDQEADPIANAFTAFGYHTAVLRYSVGEGLYPTQLQQLAAAVALLRGHAEEWCIDPEKIVVMGFSAGGHLAASLAVNWHRPWLCEAVGVSAEAMRPDLLVLGYAVLIAGEHSHGKSFRHLLGEGCEARLDEVSLEKLVTEQTPPTFLWTTAEDTTVPMENSLFFALALRQHGVPVELHCYEKGKHSLALANEITKYNEKMVNYRSVSLWVEQCDLWLRQRWEGLTE